MELDLIEKKIKRLVVKLRRHETHLEVFNPHDIVLHNEILGRGGEGIVQKATVFYNEIPVNAAVKTVLTDSDDDITMTLDEIEMLCLAGDPIADPALKVYGVAGMPDKPGSDRGHLVIVMEPALMNSLQLYQEEEVPLHVTYDLWSRLAAALLCIHQKRIIHQDLKPENILVTGIMRDHVGQMERVNFKISDFGMAKRLFAEKVVTDDILGTNGYHPPEVLFVDGYDFRADIFMLGITFSVMLHSPDFLKSNNLHLLLKKLHHAKQRKLVGESLFNSVLEPSFRRYRDISPEIRNMLCMMLEDQENREIQLLGIVNICNLEAQRELEQQSAAPTLLLSCANCKGKKGGEKAAAGGGGGGAAKEKEAPVTAPPPKKRGRPSAAGATLTPKAAATGNKRNNKDKNHNATAEKDKKTPKTPTINKRTRSVDVQHEEVTPKTRKRRRL